MPPYGSRWLGKHLTVVLSAPCSVSLVYRLVVGGKQHITPAPFSLMSVGHGIML